MGKLKRNAVKGYISYRIDPTKNKAQIMFDLRGFESREAKKRFQESGFTLHLEDNELVIRTDNQIIPVIPLTNKEWELKELLESATTTDNAVKPPIKTLELDVSVDDDGELTPKEVLAMLIEHEYLMEDN